MEEENGYTEFKNTQVYTEKLVTNIRYQVIEVFMVEHPRNCAMYTLIISSFIFIIGMFISNCYMLNQSEELTFHQAYPNFIDISYYEYMLQDVSKTCTEMDLSCEIHQQKGWFTMRDMKFYNSKLISRVYHN